MVFLRAVTKVFQKDDVRVARTVLDMAVELVVPTALHSVVEWDYGKVEKLADMLVYGRVAEKVVLMASMLAGTKVFLTAAAKVVPMVSLQVA